MNSESLKCLRFVFLTRRRDKNKRRAAEVSQKLCDNRDLQHFLQNTQDVSSPPGHSLPMTVARHQLVEKLSASLVVLETRCKFYFSDIVGYVC